MASSLQKTLNSIKNSINNIRSQGAFATAVGQHGKSEKFHVTVKQNYPQAERLPLPVNIDPAEITKFSPHRYRDINAGVMLAHHSQVGFPNRIDITVDNSKEDLNLYDCTGAVSLNSSMQSNVPTPFGGMNKFTHLNMPGGQWEQGNKFMAHDLKAAHYVSLRQSTRADWTSYEENFQNDKGISNGQYTSRNAFDIKIGAITNASFAIWHANKTRSCRSYSTASSEKKEDNKTDVSTSQETLKTDAPLGRKEMLKNAVKDYGSTVIIFHVGISLISLGSFYLLVSSGLDIVAILQHFGWGDSTLSNKLAAGASTFVVAYAVHKVFAPVRISITLGATPFIVKYLRNKGILKKPSSSG
ncbi:Protein FAM210B, mitochondrial [Pseudolycoriella hygida]|uniref:Protein FAM210B, mitochondrial n=1 Tax=Pseudolycoriella hygida TaxID=35572 RepID=A0A9Q0S859_9DIPT|nr:Protein FAM210B, mitochondrial [Pseudolycoriella hygida]